MNLTSSVYHHTLHAYYGDLHNHCNLSYGHGTLEEALKNAKLQLDFASVTVHGAWHDLPTDDSQLDYLVDYHEKGFEKARKNWAGYVEQANAYNRDDEFVTFPSFEWHSNKYGDHCIYFKDGTDTTIINAPDLPSLRDTLRQSHRSSLIIPHHIGYKQGNRGINWDAFTDEFSPVTEIFSFHGLSESSEGAYPYLHSMGPRHEHSTAQYGWSQGHVFGVVGSTDHHNAFPGSYGYGRLGVWAESLSRDAIWNAIKARRTYVLTGDRIELAYSLNDQVMGSILAPTEERWIEVNTIGGDSIDYIEVLHNNAIIHRENVFPQQQDHGQFKIYIEVGWGERESYTSWDVAVEVESGNLLTVEPRFRGIGPTADRSEGEFAYSEVSAQQDNKVSFQTRTYRNTSLHTPSTEGICVELEGDANTCLQITFNGQREELRLGELMTGSRTFYLGGFVSPAICFHRAIPQVEYTHRLAFLHRATSVQRDWYYVRVRQRNNQWAWSSPIWVDGKTT